MTTYLLAGGGTAGHVNPLLAIADALMADDPDGTCIVVGTAEGLESRLVPERGYELVTIPKVPFPRRPNGAALRFPKALASTISRVETVIRSRGVDVVIGVGGYASAPAYLAARRAGVPFCIHEANAKPGLANVLGAMLTPYVGVTFPNTKLRHARVVGMPLRREIATLDRAAMRSTAAAFFGLDASKPVVLVTGGSLGARRINHAIYDAIDDVLAVGVQVLHIGGERSDLDPTDIEGYALVEYCDRMDLALALADLALSRAGASTVAELTALAIPAVYVPYAVGNGEQRFNAQSAVDAGAAILVGDGEVDADWVRSVFVPLLGDGARLAAMKDAAERLRIVDGAQRMVALVREALAARGDGLAAPRGEEKQ